MTISNDCILFVFFLAIGFNVESVTYKNLKFQGQILFSLFLNKVVKIKSFKAVPADNS